MSDPSTAPEAGLRPLPWVRNWDFVASDVPRWRQRQVVEMVLRRAIPSPRSAVVKPIGPKPAWALYFIYAPQGQLTRQHEFMLASIRDEGLGVLAVVATERPDQVPAALHRYADAILWKALPGYDFSAYRLGLSALAGRSPGCSVLVLNDSVFGPLSALKPWLAAASWDLFGFTATGKIENHVQSYAFGFKTLTEATVRSLWRVMFPWIACKDRDDVIACQETRLARIASRSLSVGSFFYSQAQDLTQACPFELIDAGFPFIKRSLTESRSAFEHKQQVEDLMASRLAALRA